MPTSESILSGLTRLSNTYQSISIAFHAFLVLVIVLLAVGLLGRRLAGTMLCAPLVSVSVLAWISGNPFTGILFAAVAVALLVLSFTLPDGRARLAPLPVTIAGFVLTAFGWVYPHFLQTTSFVPYLYAAPVGIVPCPTLSAVAGLALVMGALEWRAWGIVLSAVGLVYGLFGVLRLGVTLDWVLVAGAAALLVYSASFRPAVAGKAVKA
jgi:hypothetical protein